jgi:hypothetical protein
MDLCKINQQLALDVVNDWDGESTPELLLAILLATDENVVETLEQARELYALGDRQREP